MTTWIGSCQKATGKKYSARPPMAEKKPIAHIIAAQKLRRAGQSMPAPKRKSLLQVLTTVYEP